MKYLFSLLIAFVCFSANAQEKNITLTITGIESDKGTIRFGVFKNQTEFETETSDIGFELSKTDMVDGTLTFSFALPAGTWGISVLDDENDNEKMEYNFIGIPKEGFGFSDFYLSGLSRPTFEDFDFSIEDGEAKNIIAKMRYM